jgi:hypothetical protein
VPIKLRAPTYQSINYGCLLRCTSSGQSRIGLSLLAMEVFKKFGQSGATIGCRWHKGRLQAAGLHVGGWRHFRLEET